MKILNKTVLAIAAAILSTYAFSANAGNIRVTYSVFPVGASSPTAFSPARTVDTIPECYQAAFNQLNTHGIKSGKVTPFGNFVLTATCADPYGNPQKVFIGYSRFFWDKAAGEYVHKAKLIPMNEFGSMVHPVTILPLDLHAPTDAVSYSRFGFNAFVPAVFRQTPLNNVYDVDSCLTFGRDAALSNTNLVLACAVKDDDRSPKAEDGAFIFDGAGNQRILYRNTYVAFIRKTIFGVMAEFPIGHAFYEFKNAE